ncbi:MAG: hypothetical protein KBD78_16000 [Oligoflexales bacterium]|nr:hypothetical protein [Oligoflexales bacterium]
MENSDFTMNYWKDPAKQRGLLELRKQLIQLHQEYISQLELLKLMETNNDAYKARLNALSTTIARYNEQIDRIENARPASAKIPQIIFEE